MKVRAAKGGSRKTILLFFFLFLHMEVTGEEEVRVRHVPLPPRKRGGEAGEGERTADRQTDKQKESGGAGKTTV